MCLKAPPALYMWWKVNHLENLPRLWFPQLSHLLPRLLPASHPLLVLTHHHLQEFVVCQSSCPSNVIFSYDHIDILRLGNIQYFENSMQLFWWDVLIAVHVKQTEGQSQLCKNSNNVLFSFIRTGIKFFKKWCASTLSRWMQIYDLSLTGAEIFLYKPRDQKLFSICNHQKCLGSFRFNWIPL